MKRVLVVVAGVVALTASAMPSSEAATPLSVVGYGRTMLVFCPTTSSSCSSGIHTNVRVDALLSTGALVIEGFDRGPVNCVRSAVVNGRKGVVVRAASTDNPTGRLALAINEGGLGRQPWALAVSMPKGSSAFPCTDAGAREVASQPGCSGCLVPANRYRVVGG
jgi:hypothetical protein